MALLYEDYECLDRETLAAEPLVLNTFDKYFAPIDKIRTRLTWLEPGKVQIKMPHAGSSGVDYSGPGANLGTLGGVGGTIPSTLLRATWNIKFRFIPEERTVENLFSHFLFWGCGYWYSYYFGPTLWPLFRIFLDARDNHLYIVFDGQYKDFHNPSYPFGKWQVDLGPISDFYEWQNFTVWVDVEKQSFAKIVFGKKEVPFPPGYALIHNDQYAGSILNGLLAGDLFSGSCTNVTLEVDDMEIWADYHTPPAEGELPLPWWLLALLVADGLIVGRSLTVKEEK